MKVKKQIKTSHPSLPLDQIRLETDEKQVQI